MPEVFISYARSTEAHAERIAAALRDLGYGVWRDDQIPANRAYAEVIEERVRAANAVVVIWSEAAIKSEWVRAEADVARKAGTLVQLSLDGVTPPMPFNQIQYVKMTGWDGDLQAPTWRKLVASIAGLLDGEVSPGAPPSPPRPPQPVAAAPPTLSLPHKPSIAVLPFSDLSGEADQAYFADGMREEITNALTHFPTLFVIATGSVLQYPPGSRDLKTIGRELGVRYLLEGSVQKSGGRVRIGVKLVNAIDAAQIWAQRFDDSLEDVFALQDHVASSVAGALDSTLETAEIRRATVRPSADLDAYDLYLQALPLSRAWDRDLTGKALSLIEASIDRDPNYAPALMLAGFVRSQLFYSGWSDAPEDCRRIGLEHCRRALRLAPGDPLVLSLASTALMSLGDDAAECARVAERAFEINPGSAGVLLGSGWVHAVHGDPDLAIARIDASLRLDPRTPLRPFHLTAKAIALFALRRFDEAAALLYDIVHALPDYPVAQVFLGASLAHLGRLAEAKMVLDKVGPAIQGSLAILSEPQRLALLQEGVARARAA